MTRRRFLGWALSVAAAAGAGRLPAMEKSGPRLPPVFLFDKVCVQAGLGLDETVGLVRATGLAGVDCAVRVGDRIEPERVRQDLPRYQTLLKQDGRRVGLLTTAILGRDSPHGRAILETAGALGIRFYRLGFLRKDPALSVTDQIRHVRAQLETLLPWNRELGLCALLQNHSPAGGSSYLGGDLAEMTALIEGFDPALVAVAFDPGHALLVHGEAWLDHLPKLRPYLGAVYVKDADRRRRFVPFGEGELGPMGVFRRLRSMGYDGPLSLHIEYDWGREGRRTPRDLVQAVEQSLAVLRQWWDEGGPE